MGDYMLVLTSCLDFYEKDSLGRKVAHVFGNKNGILDCIKKNVLKCENFVFVASNPHEYEETDLYASLAFKSFELTLPFKNYIILDGRMESKVEEVILGADLIFLCGGHLPTQNKFFNDIKLKEVLKKATALIIGGSAGSMNCAQAVYCPPELEGESLDPNFKRELEGLDLSCINIFPHYDVFKNFMLDGKKYMEEIVFPDSYDKNIIALEDGAYIVQGENQINILGNSYLVKNGRVDIVSKNESPYSIFAPQFIEGKVIDLKLAVFRPETDKCGFTYLSYNILLKDSKTIVGSVSAKIGDDSLLDVIGNVGYEVDLKYRGKGFAVEATKMLLSVFKMNGMNNVRITNIPENKNSRRVCEKLGAQYVGQIDIPEGNIRRVKYGETKMNVFVVEIK